MSCFIELLITSLFNELDDSAVIGSTILSFNVFLCYHFMSLQWSHIERYSEYVVKKKKNKEKCIQHASLCI